MKKILSLFALTTLLFSAFVSSQTKMADDSSQIIDSARKKELLDSAEMLDSLASEYSKKGDYNKAIEFGEQALIIYEGTIGKEHPYYASLLTYLFFYYRLCEENGKAIERGEEAREIYKQSPTEDIDYAFLLQTLASCYHENKENRKAIERGEEAREIYKKSPTEDLDYASLLSDLFSYYLLCKENGKAIECGEEAREIYKKSPTEDIDYASLLRYLAWCYHENKENGKAIERGEEAREIYKKSPAGNHDYASLLSDLAFYNSEICDYRKAIELGEEARRIYEKAPGKEHTDYAKSLSNLSFYYREIGDDRKAIELKEESLKIYEETPGEHPYYVTSLSNLASLYSSIGGYRKAIELGEEVRGIYEKTLGKEHPDYAGSLSNLASIYRAIGDYPKAIELRVEAREIYEKTPGKEHPDYATSLSNLASLYGLIGDDDKAIELEEEALKILEKTLTKECPEYANSLSSLSLHYRALGDYRKAIELEEEALKIYERTLGKKHPDHATSLIKLAFYYMDIGDYRKAIELGEKAREICEKTLRKEHKLYELVLKYMTKFYFLYGDEYNLNRMSNDVFHTSRNIIKKNFLFLTENERTLFWNEYEHFFLKDIHLYASHYPSISLLSTSYNSVLLGKGLLLSNTQALNNLIQNSGDKELKKLLEDIRINLTSLHKQYEMRVEDRTINTDSLESRTERMERTLIRKSKAYGDFTKNMDIEWTHVQAKLEKNDAAIEFVSFNTDNDSTIYAAYVLKKGMKSPAFVKLFEEKQLKNDISIYSNHEAAKLIWEPMAEYLADVKNVYFAPSGQLYNIAIESIPHWSADLLMSEKWNIYRLSSTRELVISKDKHKTETAMLYGGIKYDTDTATLIENGKKYPQLRDFSPSIPMDSLNIRGGFNYLEETKTEIENINNSLKGLKINAYLFTDTVATEASFKALAGKGKNLIHLATHGFYWTEKDAEVYKGVSFLMSDDATRNRDIEDRALTRSGVVFAGANTSLKGQKLPNGIDDGVLTAAELMLLDLHDVDFVALSSCQSGLGEIKGDGVFGLQRGFKIAGVKTLLMSIWKVNDEATQLLMTEFYKNFASGKSKRESLLKAQKFLREYEKEVKKYNGPQHNAAQKQQAQEDAQNKTTEKIRPYKSPYYWAAFILLDALD